MARFLKRLSIKRLIILVVILITTLSLLVASGANLYNQITSYKQSLKDNVVVFADLISRSAINAILDDDIYTEEQNLTALTVSEVIENVHIYRLSTEGELKFFSSYNKQGIAPVKEKLDQTDTLAQPKISSGVVEVIRPIEFEGKLLGYTYLRTSSAELDELIWRSIVVTSVTSLFCLAFCLVFTIKLQRTITRPVESMVRLVQRISRQKDYSSRAEMNGIKELDLLSEAFNGMLQRTQDHLDRQTKAEREQARLNVSLEEKVQQRTQALKEANNELIETLEKLHQFQRQMVQNEKMASLGDMVAGVAHEVNTPIGLGVTASTMMLDRLIVLRQSFEEKTLKASALSKFLTEGEENLNIIYRNLNRAAELISSFKQVAVDQSSENDRVFSFSKLMDEILLSMRPKLKKVNHKITITCPEDLYIQSKAGPINQIFINLIMNSIIHGFEHIDQGEITIRIYLVDSVKICIEFSDNGKGIPEQMRQRIFEPFVTTKRGQGGSGLGMHLVYNLVTQALNGSISISNGMQQGVKFNILFPVKVVDSQDYQGTL